MYTIQALKVGEQLVPGPEIYYQTHFDKRYLEYFYIFLIQGQGRTILIDTGFPEDISAWDAWTKETKGADYYWRRDAMPDELLATAGIAPADVEDVILSSLGGYAASNVHLFPNARFHVGQQGWLELLAHNTARHVTHPGPVVSWLVTEAFDHVHLIDREATIAPGISAFECGCHHRGSLAVSVETNEGRATVADCVFYYGNVEGGPVLGALENYYECLESYDRIRREAAIVVPIHDPSLLDRHTRGRIGAK